MQDSASGPEPAEFLNPSQRRAAWQQLHNGVEEDELCLPCQLATESNAVCSIGTQEWINNGFVGPGGQLKSPLSYCTLCRHIIRAKEYARIKAITTTTHHDIEFDWLEPFIFCHDEGMNLDRDTGSLENLEVEKCRNSRSIRRDLVDIDRIKSWLDGCETCHIEEGCNNHRDGASIEHGDLLLIDVQNDCLVQRNFTDRYFTLSYVWGSSRQFLTLKENYQSLLNPGSIPAQPVTQTIRDSMNLVKSIGERYLWVDTMCIIQDDLDTKAKAIAQMSAIYSCAVATIVCLSGTSADAGIPGVSPTLRNPTAVYIAPGLSVIKRPNLKLDKNEDEYTYVTRAWTFQEQLLSNRNIIFLGEQVYFQCNKELLSEDTYVHSSIDRTYLPTTLESVRRASELNKKRKKQYSPIEEFRWYEEFVPSYTAKQMGFPTDIINAFVGVQTQLGKIFGWIFAEGLPLQLFDIAILWTPIESVVRRITEPPHPSWSWSGWVGRVHYKDTLANLDWPGGLNFGKNFRKTAALEYDATSPATLDFEGESISLGAFIVKLSEQNLLNLRARLPVTPHTLLIHDQSGLRCGILYGLQNAEIASMQEGDYQLLRLSEWQTMLEDLGYHGPYISYLMESGYEHREKLFDEVLQNTPWCTLNVICVQRKGKVWQRVAVGHVHADAWKEAGPVTKKMSLN